MFALYHHICNQNSQIIYLLWLPFNEAQMCSFREFGRSHIPGAHKPFIPVFPPIEACTIFASVVITPFGLMSTDRNHCLSRIKIRLKSLFFCNENSPAKRKKESLYFMKKKNIRELTDDLLRFKV